MDDEEVGHSTLIEHRFVTGNSLPFRQIDRTVRYLRRIFIERAKHRPTSGHYLRANQGEYPAAFPIEVVAKLDDTVRICVDYMQLNQMRIKDAYLLRRIY